MNNRCHSKAHSGKISKPKFNNEPEEIFTNSERARYLESFYIGPSHYDDEPEMCSREEFLKLTGGIHWGPVKPYMPRLIDKISSYTAEDIRKWVNKSVRVVGKLVECDYSLPWKIQDIFDNSSSIELNILPHVENIPTENLVVLVTGNLHTDEEKVYITVISLIPFSDVNIKQYYNMMKLMGPFLPEVAF